MKLRVQVDVNNERLCTAGLPDAGVLGPHIQIVDRNPESELAAGAWPDVNEPQARLEVSAMKDFTDDGGISVYWAGRELHAGDVIVVRILDHGEFDFGAVYQQDVVQS